MTSETEEENSKMKVYQNKPTDHTNIKPVHEHVSPSFILHMLMSMMDISRNGSTSPRIIQWCLDTRPLWPVTPKGNPREAVQELKTVAFRALSLLSESEQTAVLRYYHVKDAKMSLASHLLKHLVITKYCNVPWSRSTVSRDANGKPCFLSEHVIIDFNVSHQAGIVSLIASIGFKEKAHVGTDVVCANERIKQDHAHIDKSGFFDWVDMHGDVFAESELNYMKLSPVPVEVDGKEVVLKGCGNDALSRCQWRNGNLNVSYADPEGEGEVKNAEVRNEEVVDRKLRRFYAMWCLREAYVKMTGEALLAPWLKDLEITDVQPPRANQDIQDVNSLQTGNVTTNFPIFFKGEKVNDVKMELAAFGSHYMIGGAIRIPKAEQGEISFGKWVELDLEKNILSVAESAA